MGAAATFIIGDALLNKGQATSWLQTAVGKGPKAAESAVGSPPTVAETDRENAAQKEAEKRRRAYARIGRSATILTTPAGLGTLGESDAAPKQLLGI